VTQVPCLSRRSRGWRVAAAAVALTSALLLPGRAGSAPTAAACAVGTSVVWLKAHEDAGAGSSWYTVAVTNLSTRGCSLRGYPGVSAIDLARRQLGTPAGRNPRDPVRTIVVAPGASAQFLLQLHDPGFFPKASCGPATAAGIRVYLPNTTRATVVPVAFGACSRRGPAFLHATAVTR
jgi:Protein of unknown function (DUF4232)